MKRLSKIVICLTMMFSMFMIPTKAATTGDEIVTYAKKYLGYSYVYGTKGPTTFDCSGFVYYVYNHFGLVSSYHNSMAYYSSPATFGTVVSQANAKPGDVIAWQSHMAIYIGDGKCINALNEDYGICILDVSRIITACNTTPKYIRMKGISSSSSNVSASIIDSTPQEEDTNEAPVISSVKVSNITSTGYDISCNITDDSKVKSVKVSTYNSKSYASKPVTESITSTSSTYTYHVDYTKFNKETNCSYYTVIKATDDDGSTKSYKTSKITVGTMKLSLSTSTYTYNGNAKKPTVYVKDALGNSLVKDTDFTVTYPSGRINPGSYTITVKGKGKYKFTKTISFKIKPKGTYITSLSAKAGEVDVKWAAQTTQTSGYQLRISKNSDFSTYKTFNVSIKNNHEEVIGLLRSHTYYVKVRTYKTVNSVKYVSSWSAVKSIKTK